uniref:FCP1 homology domain-containing protein n=1 Tax=viral metagenome TaxID=1070528 RepID=A0A6C0BJK8_9ZZZZ
MAGLILVWDMDNTLSGEYSNNITLNPNALHILQKAYNAKRSGTVSAIFLLTNNSDLQYIEKVRIELLKRLGLPEGPSPAPFNYIMPRQHTNRPQSFDPPKRLQDVEFMMRQVKKGVGNLAERVFFFDDIPTHVLRKEIPADNYIQINPPFTAGGPDHTEYTTIERYLNATHSRTKKKATQRDGRRYLKRKLRRTQKKRRITYR